MSDLMVDFITSIDSYGTATDWPGYWGMEGPEYLAWLREVGAQEHITLMGATTYRELAGYAAAMPDDPGLAAMTACPRRSSRHRCSRRCPGPTRSWSAAMLSRLCGG